jgi:hypothetical protein
MSLNDVKSKASHSGENLILAHETLYTRRFSSTTFSSWKSTSNTIRDDSHIYEVLALNKGVYFYVDIDSYDPVHIYDIVTSIRTLCQKYFDINPTFQIASSCSYTKQSYHIVSSLAFESISDAGSFAYVLNGMHKEVDMNVYKQHQNWRMLYQSKAGDPTRPFTPFGDSSTDIKDHLIGVYSSRGIFKNRFAGVERPVMSISESGIDIIEYLDMTIKTHIPEYKTHMSPLEYVLSCIPNTGNGQPWIVWLYVGFALRNIQADVSLWIDWSNTWNNGDQTKQCSDIWNHMVPRNDGFNLGTLIKCANQYAPRRINETFSIGALDDIHGIQQKDCVYTETYVRPYVLPEGVSCLLERSQMGTGKTYQLFEYIKKHTPSRIIHMSARQDYTTSIHGDYLSKGIDMKHYLKDGTLDASRIIIQMESLWKCKDVGPYDLVVLDEIESLLKQWSSSHTMKGKVATNARAFEFILQNASVVLGMDAFLSHKSVDCLNQLGIPAYVRWNTFQPQSRVAIDCQSKGGLLGTLVGCLKKGQKCVMFTASQQFGTDVLATVNHAFPHLSTRYYNSSVDDSIRDELRAVQDAWKSLDLLVYSPCITVGVNFDIPHFDTLFLYGSCMSTNIRDCFQSSMRARHIRTNECYYALHTKSPSDVPTSRNDIVEHIGNSVPFYNSTRACPRWLLNVHIHNIQEDNFHRTNYRDTWDYFLRTCGYTIVDAVVSEIYDLHRDSPVVYSDIPDVPCEAVKEVEQAITHRNATSHVKRMFSKFVFDSYTCTDESDIEKSFIFDHKWKNKALRKKLKNMSDERFSTPQYVAKKEMNNASFVEIAATHSRTSAFDTLKKIVDGIGIDHSTDSCSWFTLPGDKARASRLINTWSGGTIVKAKKYSFRIKKKI